MNSLDFIDRKLDEVREKIRVAVLIDILTEGVKLGLSRLQTLDPEYAATYQAALDALK